MGTEKKEIVGMIRGCIKTVTCGQKLDLNHKSQNDAVKPLYTKLAYVLGLRVSPFHRYRYTNHAINDFFETSKE